MLDLEKLTEEEEANTYGGAFLAIIAAIPAVVLAITSISNLFRSFTSNGSSSGAIKTKEFDYKWENEAPKASAESGSSKADNVPIYFGY
ncbi:hypothetical protein ACA758_01070 [Mycoplasmopsis agassizii]|uniref:Uncharacterized protein n=1 Tax=Mycoplasmopsis agassizii TaxID=33922 RepID=A0A1W1WYB0_9BACT|nr:hypothetical protein [Mycoplasmopsis agassizii]PAF54666.1 hypothetical protein CJF60_02925 [Mycoplasmopsis agassizii]PAK21084.1 hypothetical protein CJJ23_03740 [Mycoplasmopsis agassizii]SMC16101.1 hypothetical protein SAMN02745179_00216 [Mycoplasmopsis agassizii]